MSDSRKALALGLSIFAMFFGAGNVVFPLLISAQAGHHWLYGVGGMFLIECLIPFVALYVAFVTKDFFGPLPSSVRKGVHILLNCIIGPFVAIPRLLTLMVSNLQVLLPDVSYGIVFAIVLGSVLVAAYSKSRLIGLLGGVLTPMLLASLTLMIGKGLFAAPALPETGACAGASFSMGIRYGYLMMDLLAGLVFSSVVVQYADGFKKPRKMLLVAFAIAGIALSAVYLGLTFIGIQPLYGQTVTQETMFAAVSRFYFGSYGELLAAVIVFLACYTTAVSFANTSGTFVEHTVFKGKLAFRWSMALSIALSSAVSLVGFDMLHRIALPALNVLYPLLIAFTGVRLVALYTRFQGKAAPQASKL